MGNKFDRTLQTLHKAKEIAKEAVTSPTRRHHNEGTSGDVELVDVKHSGEEEVPQNDDVQELEEDESELTDQDGWTYCDNQWKGANNKGGLGKYTRYRKWTRLAILTEYVEPASVEDVEKQTEIMRHSRTSTSASMTKGDVWKENTNLPRPEEPKQASQKEDEPDDEKSRLRHRLKAAFRGNSISS